MIRIVNTASSLIVLIYILIFCGCSGYITENITETNQTLNRDENDKTNESQLINPDIEKQIKQDYFDTFIAPEYASHPEYYYHLIPIGYDIVQITRYYGTYNGSVSVLIEGFFSYLTVMTYEKVAGVIFEYGSSNTMLVWKEGKFYKLSEAYDLKFLTEENIRSMPYQYGGLAKN